MPNNDAEEYDDDFKEIVRRGKARRDYHALVEAAAQRTAERLGLSLKNYNGMPEGFQRLQGDDSFEWNGEQSFVFYIAPGRNPIYCAMVDLAERRYKIFSQKPGVVFFDKSAHRIVDPLQKKREEFAVVFNAEVERYEPFPTADDIRSVDKSFSIGEPTLKMVLEFWLEAPEELPRKDLAKSVGVSESTLTKAFELMRRWTEKQGHPPRFRGRNLPPKQ